VTFSSPQRLINIPLTRTCVAFRASSPAFVAGTFLETRLIQMLRLSHDVIGALVARA